MQLSDQLPQSNNVINSEIKMDYSNSLSDIFSHLWVILVALANALCVCTKVIFSLFLTTGTAKVTTTLSNSTVTMATDKLPHQAGMTVSAVAAVASSLFTAAATQSIHLPQANQLAQNTASNTPVNNPNASPRPSILRKRTNEG